MNNSIIRLTTLSKKCCKIHSTLNGIKINSVPSLHPQVRYQRLSSNQIMYNTIPQPKYTASKQERDEFHSIFPDVIKDLTEPYQNNPAMHTHLTKLLNDNAASHNHTTGLLVVTAYKVFAHPNNLNTTSIHLANILGWCTNLWFCSWNINDKITATSDIRNRSLSWHKNDEIGLKAVYDSVFSGYSPYILLKKYFSSHDVYLKAIEWFHEVNLNRTFGQTLNSMCLKNGKLSLEACTMERFELLAKYKESYMVMLPIILAMHLANKTDTNLYKQAESVLIRLGNYYAVQNDIVDCYGDPLITGKNGDDISEGKCTWLIVKALQKATPQQRQILERYYGRSGIESDLEVTSLYEDLGIFEEFLEFEKESFDKLSKCIREIPDDFPVPYFLKLLDSYYGRGLSEC